MQKPLTLGTGIYDRKRGFHDLAKNEDVDFIVGDWMSEGSMTLRGVDRYGKNEASRVGKGWEPYFLTQIEPSFQYLAQKGIRVCINAGGSDAEGLAIALRELIKKRGHSFKVGYVDGDEVTDIVSDLIKQGTHPAHIDPLGETMLTRLRGHDFKNLNTGLKIKDWDNDMICAQAYLGGAGIAAAFESGAQIVVCGRVADASVLVGPAMYWHGWTRENLDELAGALMIGHIIECSTYATGGYYSGFKDLGVHDTDMGYPIAAVDHKGEAVVYMEQGRDGLVTPATVTSQLLYEIQGQLYYNSDVTSNITNIQVDSIGKNQVRVHGVKGESCALSEGEGDVVNGSTC